MARFLTAHVGKDHKGDWYPIPAVVFGRVIRSDEPVGDLLARYAIPTRVARDDCAYIAIGEPGHDALLFEGRPPVTFIIEEEDLERLRDRRREGETPDMLVIETFANARTTPEEPGCDVKGYYP
jgi:hypothetical protein